MRPLLLSLFLAFATRTPSFPQNPPPQNPPKPPASDSSSASLNETWTAAMAAMKARQYDAAIPLLVRVTTMAPTQDVAWVNLGEAYGNLAGTRPEADRPELYSKAVECYHHAISLKPDQPSYLANYGLWLARTGQIDAAESSVDKAVKLDAANAGTYYFNMGAIFANSGRDLQAVQTFRKVPVSSAQFPTARAQAIRLTLGLYIDAAKTQFQSMKGRQLLTSPEVTSWDAAATLPGADYCGVFLTSTTQLSCTFESGKDLSDLKESFNSLIHSISSALPNGWKGAVIADVTEDRPTYRFTGPRVTISLKIEAATKGPVLGMTVEPD
jgi:Flp pilus assembly protein TadD